LNGLTKLKALNCSNNKLTCFDYNELSKSPNLTSLNIGNNNFVEQRLYTFNKFTKLEKLYLGSDKEEKNSQFRGSLKYLEKLNELRELDISGTNISSGLEYLPKKFKKLYCNPNSRSKSTSFAQVFSKYLTYENNGKYYDIS